jgi:polysaccharide biosynthesis/export protein
VRGSLSDPQIAIVDFGEITRGRAPDVPLEPRDIVYVPFSPYRVLARYLDVVLNTFVRAVAINEGARAVRRDAVPVGVGIPIGFPQFGTGGTTPTPTR